jgi:hypothetical protein
VTATLRVDGGRTRGHVHVAPHDELEVDEAAATPFVTTPLGTWHVRETVTRQPDRGGARVYAIAEQRYNGESGAEVTLDADGHIASAHGDLFVGEVDVTAH